MQLCKGPDQYGKKKNKKTKRALDYPKLTKNIELVINHV